MAAPPSSWSWQVIALTSGTFAALNGVFAKLTTSSTTSSWSAVLAQTLRIPPQHAPLLEYVLRITIFITSFVLSSTMWAIYTRALAAAPSAVHANALNTSANFVVAALCGAILFGEALGGLWWVGAGLLIAGTAVIGRSRDSEGGSSMESEKKGAGRRGGGRKSARQKRDKKDE